MLEVDAYKVDACEMYVAEMYAAERHAAEIYAWKVFEAYVRQQVFDFRFSKNFCAGSHTLPNCGGVWPCCLSRPPQVRALCHGAAKKKKGHRQC